MIKEFNFWINNILVSETLSEKIFIYLPECGLGDKITCFPAFRILKKLNPNKKIVLVTEESVIDVWKLNKYIDFIIPQEILSNGLESIFIRNVDSGKICDWSYFEHHQQNVVKSCVKYIAGVMPDEKKDDLTYEFELTESQLEKAENIKNQLLNLADGKKLIGISPANTMFSRMWSKEYWEKLVDLLHDHNYFVVSFGGKNDLNISNVDFDGRGKIGVVITPKVLDIFDYVVVCNNGMLHIAFVNQDVKIVYLNTGQYFEKIMLPYRKNNNQYYNVIVINHNCDYRAKCFEGHITNREINKQMENYKKEFMLESGESFPMSQHKLLQKFTCWYYCYKDRNKFSCNKQITPEMVLEKIL